MAPKDREVLSVHGDSEAAAKEEFQRGKTKVISEVTSIELQSTIKPTIEI